MQSWDLLAIEAPDGTRDPVVLTSDDDARAVLIRIGAGQELGDHQVKEVAWIVVVDGRVRVRCGAEEVDVGTGALFRFEPDERHAVASDDGARILLLLSPWPGAGHYRGQQSASR
ncbi:MAG: cupin domain-containing protein [Thermoleophilia bacterium]|nr:cupin domain-containing protein [Thermoleophilia bacterium]